jgi:hypothetical protein
LQIYKTGEEKTNEGNKTTVAIAIMIVAGFFLLASTTILMLVYFDVYHDFVEGFKWLKPVVKYILPIELIFVTLYVAFVLARIFADRFDGWITWETFQKKQSDLIQIDATIITGLFILLGFAFQIEEPSQTQIHNATRPQIEEPSQTHSLFPKIDVKSWIIGITAPTVFPFVASFLLLVFYGFSASKLPENGTDNKGKEVTPWPAKMGLLLMLLGFVWIMGDLVAFVLLLT